MTINDFLEEFKHLYPEFKEEIEEDDGRAYMQADVVRNAISEAVESGTLEFVMEVLSLIAEAIKTADDELKKMLEVSILDHLEIDRESIDQMPELLLELCSDIVGHGEDTEAGGGKERE